MQIEFRDITPILGVFAVIATAAAALDYLLRNEYKRQAFLFAASLSQVGYRPRTLSFYGLMTLISLGFTFIIISVNGTLAASSGEHISLLRAFRSSGSLVLAIFLKVVLWDYLLALKSFFVFQRIQSANSVFIRTTHNRFLFRTMIIVIFLVDLWITGALTAGLLNWSDVFQSQHVETAKNTAPSVTKVFFDFFNEINVMITDSVQKCFYILNGSLFMYSSLGFAALSSGAVKYINPEETQKNLFKILGAFAMLVLMVILVCYKLAN